MYLHLNTKQVAMGRDTRTRWYQSNVDKGGNKQFVSVCHDHTDDNETNK